MLKVVAPPSNRKTIEIVVERDASLTLKAPQRTATVERANQFVIAKRSMGLPKARREGRPNRPSSQ